MAARANCSVTSQSHPNFMQTILTVSGTETDRWSSGSVAGSSTKRPTTSALMTTSWKNWVGPRGGARLELTSRSDGSQWSEPRRLSRRRLLLGRRRRQ